MAEAPRPRQVEYYNPRGLILGVCFFWGVVMGFLLFYLSPPKVLPGQDKPPQDEQAAGPAAPGLPNRHENVPVITAVPLAPEAQSQRPRLETMVLEPPTPALTTEGGLTGRTAQPLTTGTTRPQAGSPPARRPQQPQVMDGPPPIPDLMP